MSINNILIVKNKAFIELNEEPGTNKIIQIEISPSVNWARFYIGDQVDDTQSLRVCIQNKTYNLIIYLFFLIDLNIDWFCKY